MAVSLVNTGGLTRQRLCLFAIAFVVLSGFGCGPREAQIFYVDSADGSDENNGLSPDRAWGSLARVNATTFAPGDKILFRRGSSYRGRLHPQGSGREGKPIVIDVFGDGERPLVTSEGEFSEALLLENQEYWEINHLELTNTGPEREPFRYGVRLAAWDCGTLHHIHLKNLFVHDVNGSLVKKDLGEGHGILWENGGEQERSRFDGLLIEGCHLLRTDRNGISGYTEYSVDRAEWYPSLNVTIRNNLLEDVGGDCIKPWGCKAVLIEHNTVRGGRQRCDDYAAGIWPWACDSTVIQFNEVSGIKGFKDGQAFDVDAHCTNTLFQYNYTHDNDGGFMLVCGENSDTIVRYNISQNDRTRLFHFAHFSKNTQIYNNVFYVGEGIDVHLFLWTPDRGRWAQDTRVYNNIFYVEGVGRNSSATVRKEIGDGTFVTSPGFGGSSGHDFRNNVFYGNLEDIPEEWKAMAFDPLLVKPGNGGDGFDSLSGYQLNDGSPCLGAGILIRDNGGRDFWANNVSEVKNPSIGAHEKD